MPELTLSDFDRFFEALWEKRPFAWQHQLAKRILESSDTPWPEAIALPTGAGKTACVDIAIFTLAAKASGTVPGQALSLPRRVFFTVDRRVIVDEAYRRALHIATRLSSATKGILKEVADGLREVAGNKQSSEPLGAYLLRGGMYRAETWAKSPTRPSIICTTVDQLGSRLLFRAYGRSFKAWPIHAGLAANDSLILLDEAHCAQPLMQSLAAIRQYRTWAKTPLPNPFFVSIMSATPPSGVTDIFKDDSGEPNNPDHPLGKRQGASKRATLCDPVTGAGKSADQKLVETLAERALAHVDDTHRAIVVFCNRVATARTVRAFLSRSKRHSGKVVLLTGRMRPIDKDDVAVADLAELASDRSEQRMLEQPVFVVTTQTLEVGADLDFDSLVTECASFDALRQRFGRLNRMGHKITAAASIVIRADHAEDSSGDPVYGAALANTWRWLRRMAGESNTVDFGISALSHQLPDDDILADLSVVPPLTPVMLPAHVDGWAQTSPQPVPTADVSLFLHGVDRIAADVQVCWRADIELDDRANEDKALNTLSLVPPNVAECLPVPIGVFRRWLSGQDMADSSSDLEGEIEETDTKNDERLVSRKAVCWRNRNETTVISDTHGLRPGDVCILPASMRESLVLGDVPASNGGLDVGDRAALESRAKVTLRLHSELLKHWPQTELVCALQAWLPEAQVLYEEDPVATQAELLKRLGEIAEEGEMGSCHVWLKRACHALAGDRCLRFAPHPAGGFIVRGSRRLPQLLSEDDFGDEDDATASGTVNVILPIHLEGVGDFAARFAEACRLPLALVNALRCAGRLHDLGKADPRFQALLRGGNPWARGPLLAKSADVPQSRQRYSEARAAAGYPQGGRHELLSVRLAESAPDILPDDPLLCDLVLHLVASHHGYCRPFAPVIVDDSPRQVTVELDGVRMMSSSDTQLERLDSGISERYWRLTHQFGWWGLAWLEAILRLADHRRSEWEESHIGERE